jgi:hypothetical protein
MVRRTLLAPLDFVAGVQIALATAAMLLSMSVQAAALEFVEPPDLTSNLSVPDDLGPLVIGENTIAGSIDGDCTVDEFCGPDDADSFSFEVPDGLTATNIELVISNFASIDNAQARVRNFSGGTSTEFINGNLTFADLITEPDGLGPGTYDLQIHSVFDLDPVTFEQIGAVSLDWAFQVTVVPEPGAMVLGLGALLTVAVTSRLRASGASRSKARISPEGAE